ncbi:MAG: hypothetical protein ABJH93_13545, partial [Roseibium sp.]
MNFKYLTTASEIGQKSGNIGSQATCNGINPVRGSALRRRAVAVSLTALMLPPVSASAEDLTVDNSRETISSEEVYGTIRV